MKTKRNPTKENRKRTRRNRNRIQQIFTRKLRQENHKQRRRITVEKQKEERTSQNMPKHGSISLGNSKSNQVFFIQCIDINLVNLLTLQNRDNTLPKTVRFACFAFQIKAKARFCCRHVFKCAYRCDSF